MPDWFITKDGDRTCFGLYLRHYSSAKRPAGDRMRQFVGPGEHIVLRTRVGDAVFVWRKHFDKTVPPQTGIECSLFRNEGPIRSSELVRQADAVADFCWPGLRHYTKVGAAHIRSSNPGFCFLTAGWRRCGMTKGGLHLLERKECETLPVQKSGLDRAEHGGGGADPIQRLAAVPTQFTDNR